MMRFLVAIILLISFAPPADAQLFGRWFGNSGWQLNSNGRYCNNPNCEMCNRLFGPMYSQRQPMASIQTQYVAPVKQMPATVWSVVQPQPIAQPIIVEHTPREIPRAILHAFDPTPQEVVDDMLSIVMPTPADVVYDLGCGDGRILATAFSDYGARGVGIEINPQTASMAREKTEGMPIRIIEGDAAAYDISDATIVTMYLYPPVVERLVPQVLALKPGTKVISYSHPMPGLAANKIEVDGNEFYIWIR